MTRAEMIEAMARAAKRKSPAYWSEVRDADKHWAKAMGAALSAIERAGMVVVPLSPTLLIQNAGWKHLQGQGVDPETVDMAPIYSTMIESGRIKP